jgi:hypothetical protein
MVLQRFNDKQLAVAAQKKGTVLFKAILIKKNRP